MNNTRVILIAAIWAAVVYIIKIMLDMKSQNKPEPIVNNEETSKYLNTVAEVLARNNDRDTIMSQAFERALEQETQLEEELAKDEGLRSM